MIDNELVAGTAIVGEWGRFGKKLIAGPSLAKAIYTVR
jgi:hypothetical protein